MCVLRQELTWSIDVIICLYTQDDSQKAFVARECGWETTPHLIKLEENFTFASWNLKEMREKCDGKSLPHASSQLALHIGVFRKS